MGVNGLGIANLLNYSLIHNNYSVTHNQCLGLVMRNIN